MAAQPHHIEDDSKLEEDTPHPRTKMPVRHVPNNTVSSLAQLLGHGVAIIHDKVLVENLKDLPSLQL